MRKFGLVLILAVTLFSCHKNSNDIDHCTEENTGCIERLAIPVTSMGNLSTSDYNMIRDLFIANSISSPNYRFTRTYTHTAQTYNGLHDYRNVFVIQYIHGLPLFHESLNFLFKDGTFESYAGTITNGTSLNTTPATGLGALRRSFLIDIENFDHSGTQFSDSCFKAEFGYYDLNDGTGAVGENIVKAWHITPKHTPYPEAYYQDGSMQRIYYFNGRQTFH